MESSLFSIQYGHKSPWRLFLSITLFFMLPAMGYANCQKQSPSGSIQTHAPTFHVRATTDCQAETLTLSIKTIEGEEILSDHSFSCTNGASDCRVTPDIDLSNGRYQWNFKVNGALQETQWMEFDVVSTWYQDADGDGYGNPDVSTTAVEAPDGYIATGRDCDDTNKAIHPGADDLCGDGVDQDCNASDQSCDQDLDMDGWRPQAGDCNDNDANIHPNAPEICGDGVDQNCIEGDLSCTEVVCSDIADAPRISRAAPPNIMILLETSIFMENSVLTKESPLGAFLGTYYSIFPDVNYLRNIDERHRNQWKGRYHGYNRMYYNPSRTYAPWPSTQKYPSLRAFSDADDTSPHLARSHPIHDQGTLDLNAQYASDFRAGVEIINAHYFASHNDEIYLVQLPDTGITYHRLNDPSNLDTKAGGVTEITGDDIPPITRRSIAEERQNFANWFTFHRKRIFSAINTLSINISLLDGVNLGIFTSNHPGNNTAITQDNGYIIQPVVPIGVNGQNRAHSLQNKLYELNIRSSNFYPKLAGPLASIGQYFDATDTVDPEGLGESPYLSEENGGGCQQAFTLVVTDGFRADTITGFGDQDGDGSQNTLADVAMYYYKTDLSSLPDQVPTSEADSLSTQHMTTYVTTQSFIDGSLDPADYPDCPTGCDTLNPTCDKCPEWPTVIPGLPGYYSIDEMYHCAINSRGEYFYNDTPLGLSNSVNGAMKSIMDRITPISDLSGNSSLSINQNTVFHATFTNNPWVGDLKAYGTDTATGALNTTPTWSASEQLSNNLKSPGWWSSGRKIFTTHGETGLAFSSANAATLGLSQDIVNYIRGDDRLEGEESNDFRPRDQVLGDIVHAAPHYINNTVFVGANDGMLHAFDADTGNERFAFIPSFVLSNLPKLAEQNYQHRYFVDQTPHSKTVSETTYLVGGLKKGGKGYYCLDVSPSNLNPSNESIAATTLFKWEYPTQTDDDMGYSFSQAYIVKSQAGWVVIFGNGYESNNGKAVLYVLRLSDGHLLKKIDTQYGDAGTDCNGLSTPSIIDIDDDGIVDYAYAGDLRGNLWKFDLTDSDPTQWDISFKDGTNTPQPLFRAMNKNGHAQPITTKPDVINFCDQNKKGYLVVFGTGRLLGETDATDFSPQSIYGIWDWTEEWKRIGESAAEKNPRDKYLGEFNSTSPSGIRTLSNVADLNYLDNTLRSATLLEQRLVHTENSDYRVVSNNLPIWYSKASEADQFHLGWYLDLPQRGEKMVQNVSIQDKSLIFISHIPARTSCSNDSQSFFMRINACTGGRTSRILLDISGDGKINDADRVLVDDPNSPGNRIWVSVSGISFDGLIYLPATLPLEKQGLERNYFPVSTGGISNLNSAAENLGRYYWKKIQ